MNAFYGSRGGNRGKDKPLRFLGIPEVRVGLKQGFTMHIILYNVANMKIKRI